jgi:ribonuclease P protein subunit RPR2
VQFGHWMAYTCLECSTTRRIPAPRNTPDEPSTILPTSLRLKGRADDTADNTYEPLTQEAEGTTRSTEHEGIPKHYGTKRGRRNRKKNAVRGQSLSARRSAGHVVFMGAEEVDMEGVYCA